MGSIEVAYDTTIMAGADLSGIAESRPTDRRRTASLLRVVGILLFLSLLATIVFVPGFMIGERSSLCLIRARHSSLVPLLSKFQSGL